VKATPTSHLLPIHLSAPDIAGWGAAAAALLAAVTVLTARQKRRMTRMARLAA
jgi:isocitrate/isopropylmalate dehydrogenase